VELSEILALKREHLDRLANARGAAGEVAIVTGNTQFMSRPKGMPLRTLMSALRASGVSIKPTSFDAIAIPAGAVLNWGEPQSVARLLTDLVFIELKTASQPRVKDDFSDFFLALFDLGVGSAQT
jgi:hypothetical protein